MLQSETVKKYDTYKDSGIEWIGEIPQEWKLVKTGRIFRNIKEIVGQKSVSTERLALTLNGVIKRNKDDAEGLQPEQFDNYQYLRKNQLVFKLIDLENVNTSRVGLCPFEEGMVSPAYIVLQNNNNDNRYYHYYYLSLWHNEIFNHLGGDGVRSALNAKDLLNIPTFNLSKEEQQLIADYLDKKCGEIDKVVETEKEVIEKLKEYKQSVITEAVTKGLDKSVHLKDSGIEWIGKIPNDWNIIRIKQLLSERTERSDDGVGEPLSMSQKYGLIPTKFMDKIPNMASTLIGTKKTYINDIVFNKLKAHLGVFSVSNYNGLVSPDYAVYFSTGLANLKYLEYLFKTPQCILEFRKYSSGIADGLTRLYTSDLFGIYCPFPNILEQNKIVEYLDKKCSEINKAIADKEQVIEKFTEYKKSLIYECVTGKRKVY